MLLPSPHGQATSPPAPGLPNISSTMQQPTPRRPHTFLVAWMPAGDGLPVGGGATSALPGFLVSFLSRPSPERPRQKLPPSFLLSFSLLVALLRLACLCLLR